MTVNVEINCADYAVTGGSIGHSRAGLVFRCTLSPVSSDVVDKLEAASRPHGTVRLLFPERPLLLESVAVERVTSRAIRIVGRVVGGSTLG